MTIVYFSVEELAHYGFSLRQQFLPQGSDVVVQDLKLTRLYALMKFFFSVRHTVRQNLYHLLLNRSESLLRRASTNVRVMVHILLFTQLFAPDT